MGRCYASVIATAGVRHMTATSILYRHIVVVGLALAASAADVVACSDSSRSAEVGMAPLNTAACNDDSECPDGFCDRGECRSEGAMGRETYGRDCDAPPISSSTGRPDLTNYACGAYLCIQNRCRSCATDQECATQLGSPTCGSPTGWPGRSCGDYAVTTPTSPAAAPDHLDTPDK